MMIKPVALAVVSLGAVAAAVLTPAPVLAAPTPSGAAAQPSTSTDAAITADWGVNADGWHVHVFNDTPYKLDYVHGNMVRVISVFILPYSHRDNTRGQRSLFGGPANMSVAYRTDGGRVASYEITSGFTGRVHVNCYQEYFRCTVERAVLNQPILIRFSPK